MEDIWEGNQNPAHSRGEGMDNKEHFKRKTKESLLISWSGDQTVYVILRGRTKAPSNI